MRASRDDDPADGRLAPWRLVRATPLAVWLLCAVQFLLAAVYAFAVPLLHAPDEHAHVDRILAGDPADLEPMEDNEDLSERTLAILPKVDLFAVDWRLAPEQPWAGLPGAEAPPRDDRPPYHDLAPEASSGILNNAASHPPLYYVYEAAGLEVVQTTDDVLTGDGPWAWDRTVVTLRLLSALLVFPLPWLAYWAGVRLSRRRGVGLIAAVVPVTIPQLAHSAGSVNNDVLLLLTTSVVTLGCVWIATGDRSLRTAALTGGAAGLALLTKIFALGAPVWIAAAYGVGWWRDRRGKHGIPLGGAAAGLGVAAVSTVVFGGWYVLRLLIVHGTPAPRPFAYPPESIDPDVGYWLGEVLSRVSATFWGFFGIEQFLIPRWLIAVVSVLLVGAILLAFARGARARAPWRTADLGVLLLPMVTAGAMMLFASWQGYIRSGLPVGLHGRYLFVGLVGIAVAAALGVGGHTRLRWVALGALALAGIMHGFGLWTVVRSYYAGPDVVAEFQAMLAWSAVRGRYVAGLWATTGILAVATAWSIGALPRSAGIGGGADGARETE